MISCTIASIADIHFGNRRVPSKYTIDNIKKYLFPLISEIDVLFIAGDVFDGLISLDNQEAILAFDIINELLRLCNRHDVIMRIVRGTYSHDHKQLNFITKLYNIFYPSMDYKLYETISVEYIRKYDMSVLYIPDNLPFQSKYDIIDHINKLLQVVNVKQVDYVIMHGELSHLTFKFNDKVLSIDDFDDICKHYVLSGHIHKPLLYKKSISIGSFNRLAHNEEEAKGFWLIKDNIPKFIENEDAILFRTLDFSEYESVEDIIDNYDKYITDDRFQFVRLIINDIQMRKALDEYNTKKHPNVKLTFKRNDDIDNNYDSFINDRLINNKVVLEAPNINNIVSIISKKIKSYEVIIDDTIIHEIIHGVSYA